MENLTFAFLHKRNWDSAVGVWNRIRARGSEIVNDSRECQEICLFQTGHFTSGVHQPTIWYVSETPFILKYTSCSEFSWGQNC